MSSVANIQAAGAQVELGINDAKLQQGIERAKAEILSLSKAIKTAQEQMRAASRGGNIEEATGAKLMIDGLKARQREVRRTFNAMMTGQPTDSPGVGGNLIKAGKFGRGMGHTLGMFGGELGGQAAAGMMGIGHVVEQTKGAMERFGVAGGLAFAGVAAGAVAGVAVISHFIEAMKEAQAKMMAIGRESTEFGHQMQSMAEAPRGSEKRIAEIHKQFEAARQAMEDASAKAQGGFWKSGATDEELQAVEVAKRQMMKWGALEREERAIGAQHFSPGEGQFGGEGAQYMGGYSLAVDLLTKIEANTQGLRMP